MSRQHSIIEHRANYFYLMLEDDYLAMYEHLAEVIDPRKEETGQKLSGPSDCKAMIASVLEHWMNSKRLTAKCEEDLYVYMTYEEWEQALRYRYKRSTIIQCLKEMEIEGIWVDTEGKYGEEGLEYIGTIRKLHFVQNTFQYMLHLPVVQGLLAQLPEQSPYEQKPRPSLGRPKKNHTEINGLKTNDIKINRLNLDGQSVKTNDGSVKTNAPFYTQITQINTNSERGYASADATASHAHALSSVSRESETTNDGRTALDIPGPGSAQLPGVPDLPPSATGTRANAEGVENARLENGPPGAEPAVSVVPVHCHVGGDTRMDVGRVAAREQTPPTVSSPGSLGAAPVALGIGNGPRASGVEQTPLSMPLPPSGPNGAATGVPQRQPRQRGSRPAKPAQSVANAPALAFVLTDEQKAFWSLWCGVWFNEITPRLNETAYGHVVTLAPLITTAEDLDSLIKKARKDLEDSAGIKNKAVHLGNLVKSHPGWLQDQRKADPPVDEPPRKKKMNFTGITNATPQGALRQN